MSEALGLLLGSGGGSVGPASQWAPLPQPTQLSGPTGSKMYKIDYPTNPPFIIVFPNGCYHGTTPASTSHRIFHPMIVVNGCGDSYYIIDGTTIFTINLYASSGVAHSTIYIHSSSWVPADMAPLRINGLYPLQ